MGSRTFKCLSQFRLERKTLEGYDCVTLVIKKCLGLNKRKKIILLWGSRLFI
jgi:hypothetical protein